MYNNVAQNILDTKLSICSRLVIAIHRLHIFFLLLIEILKYSFLRKLTNRQPSTISTERQLHFTWCTGNLGLPVTHKRTIDHLASNRQLNVNAMHNVEGLHSSFADSKFLFRWLSHRIEQFNKFSRKTHNYNFALKCFVSRIAQNLNIRIICCLKPKLCSECLNIWVI